MKMLSVFAFIFFLLLCSVSFPVEGGSLTDEEIMHLIEKFDINVEELKGLRDPFLDYRSLVELRVLDEVPDEDSNGGAGSDRSSPEEAAENPDRGGVSEEDVRTPPTFVLKGLVRRGNREAALIRCADDRIILNSGKTHEGYEFSGTVGREAVFTREGHEYRLKVGGADG